MICLKAAATKHNTHAGGGAKAPPTLTGERFSAHLHMCTMGWMGAGCMGAGWQWAEPPRQGGGSSWERLQLAEHHRTKQNLLLMWRALAGNACARSRTYTDAHVNEQFAHPLPVLNR